MNHSQREFGKVFSTWGQIRTWLGARRFWFGFQIDERRGDREIYITVHIMGRGLQWRRFSSAATTRDYSRSFRWPS